MAFTDYNGAALNITQLEHAQTVYRLVFRDDAGAGVDLGSATFSGTVRAADGTVTNLLAWRMDDVASEVGVQFPDLTQGTYTWELMAVGDGGETSRVTYGRLLVLSTSLTLDIGGENDMRTLMVRVPTAGMRCLQLQWLASSAADVAAAEAKAAAAAAEETAAGLAEQVQGIIDTAQETLTAAQDAVTTAQDAIARLADLDSLLSDFQTAIREQIYIDPNTGTWVIGGTDTGVYAQGESGKSPYISTSGTWLCYDDENQCWVDSGVQAQGEDGKSPYINALGNWVVWSDGDWVDSGVQAIGQDGIDGDAIRRIKVDAYVDIPQSGDTCNGGYYYYVKHGSTYGTATELSNSTWYYAILAAGEIGKGSLTSLTLRGATSGNVPTSDACYMTIWKSTNGGSTWEMLGSSAEPAAQAIGEFMTWTFDSLVLDGTEMLRIALTAEAEGDFLGTSGVLCRSSVAAQLNGGYLMQRNGTEGYYTPALRWTMADIEATQTTAILTLSSLSSDGHQTTPSNQWLLGTLTINGVAIDLTPLCLMDGMYNVDSDTDTAYLTTVLSGIQTLVTSSVNNVTASYQIVNDGSGVLGTVTIRGTGLDVTYAEMDDGDLPETAGYYSGWLSLDVTEGTAAQEADDTSGYIVYAWVEDAEGSGEWIAASDLDDLATSTIYGLVKLGTDVVIQDGSPIGVNSNGQLALALADYTVGGLVKISTDETMTDDNSGAIGLDEDGRIRSQAGSAARYGTVKLSTSDVIDDDAANIGLKDDGTIAVQWATLDNGGVVRLGSEVVQANEVPYIVGIGVNSEHKLTNNLLYTGALRHQMKSRWSGTMEWLDNVSSTYYAAGQYYLGLLTSEQFTQESTSGLVLNSATTELLAGVYLADGFDDERENAAVTAAQVKEYLAGNYYTQTEIAEQIASSMTAEQVQTLLDEAKTSILAELQEWVLAKGYVTSSTLSTSLEGYVKQTGSVTEVHALSSDEFDELTERTETGLYITE
ncbi:MAG: hypothetical protein LUE08_07340 [Akkermansiaceae bacterium]|nr:hypothetical protein [Akkermansiaceae bacterium]